MKTRDLTELATRNLREALLRNLLTTLGIAVGVASLIAMVSLGIGLQELANKRLSKSGLFDAVFVSSKTNQRGMGRQNPPESGAPREPAKILDDEGRRKIASLPNVIEVYPEIRFPTEVQFEGKPYSTTVAGIPPSAKDEGAFDGMKGNFFSSQNTDEAILQIELAKDLSSQPDSLIGKNIVLRYAERQPLPAEPKANKNSSASQGGESADEITGQSAGFSIVPREKTFRIIGIVETEPATSVGSFGRGRLLIPMQVAEVLRVAQANDLRGLLRRSSSKQTYDSLTVRVKTPSQVKSVEDAIQQMGYGTFSLLDATKALRQVFEVFDLFLLIFGSLALAVASLGIVNTLVMAVLERRREIGILKALGAADRDVRLLFFAEAGVMGFFGGIFGVILGWLIGSAITLATNISLHRRDLPSINLTSVPWWLVGTAIVFSILVSLAAGIYPASRAAKLNPVEALRYE
jgi:putative ABC transport system permease protein